MPACVPFARAGPWMNTPDHGRKTRVSVCLRPDAECIEKMCDQSQTARSTAGGLLCSHCVGNHTCLWALVRIFFTQSQQRGALAISIHRSDSPYSTRYSTCFQGQFALLAGPFEICVLIFSFAWERPVEELLPGTKSPPNGVPNRSSIPPPTGLASGAAPPSSFAGRDLRKSST